VIVLTREVGQVLVVGGVEIVFVEDDCNGDRTIRLGIRAAASVAVSQPAGHSVTISISGMCHLRRYYTRRRANSICGGDGLRREVGSGAR